MKKNDFWFAINRRVDLAKPNDIANFRGMWSKKEA